MTIFNHLQHAKQWELYLVVWNLHSSSQKRWWSVKTPAPTFKPALLQAWRSTQVHWLPLNNQCTCYRPGEVRKCTDYSGVEEKEVTSLFHKLAHSNFSTSWGARKTVLINMMLILFYYMWQVQMMQKLHFYTWTWKDNHSSEIWIIMHSD